MVRSGVQNDVRFLGFVPIEVLRIFYDEAKIFVFPSLYEGFGLPPLEAMAHGTPVVTSNVSSLPEVVGNAAVLVNPENVFEIMRALHRVLMDQTLRDRMEKNAATSRPQDFHGKRRCAGFWAPTAISRTTHERGWVNTLPPTNCVLRLFHQRLAGRQNGEFVQLGGDAGFVGIGLRDGQALAQLDNFFFTGTAPGESPGGGWVLTFIPPENLKPVLFQPRVIPQGQSQQHVLLERSPPELSTAPQAITASHPDTAQRGSALYFLPKYFPTIFAQASTKVLARMRW